MLAPFSKEILEKAYTYDQYRQMVDDLLAQGRTTGENQSEAMVGYTQLNIQRMNRVEKTFLLQEETIELLKATRTPWVWVVFVEAWCGDVPANLPVMQKMAAQKEEIEFRLLLRDEHPDLMQHFLTNGGKSIPKLACLHSETLEVLGSWGPRPAPVQAMVMEHKANPVEPYMEMVKKAQVWYAKDRGKTIQAEFRELIQAWAS